MGGNLTMVMAATRSRNLSRTPFSLVFFPKFAESHGVLFDPLLADVVHGAVDQGIVPETLTKIPLVFLDFVELGFYGIFHIPAGRGGIVVLGHKKNLGLKQLIVS
jgi:hypothetical protein